MTSPSALAPLTIALPEWAVAVGGTDRSYASLEDRMGVAIDVARRNVEHGTGGPFGAAVFESGSGRLVAIGMNLVVSSGNAFLHAETVALMFAQREAGSWSLRSPEHDLFTSCEPCAMCLGAVLWSGVTRLVSGAAREDAMEIGFDEGPVFDASYEYLASRGVSCHAGVLRDEARAVLQDYRSRGAPIYNG
ncbi:MAG TPA: nucleoside deaminase [Gemmatimonadaceae bacterium]|nr:nucleoside deaminase [Gemmatimonadaceae bacterium]